jgi:oligopeptidase B
LAVSERSEALRRIRIRRWADNAETFIDADEPTYTMALGSTPEFDSTTVRYQYTSLTTPSSDYDYDVTTGERILRKRQPVLGPFDPANYASELIWAPARDGESIPVSLVYKKGTPLDGTAPLWQYAYGSYGASMDPTFSSAKLSLLDRGFVYAIAHIRGGQERGRRWYEDGRQLAKMNTFTDFIDVTEHLVAKGTPRPTGCSPPAAAPAACSWAR